MRPALQRLLARPSSLALLRALIEPPVADGACNKQWTAHIKSTLRCPCQSYASASVASDAFLRSNAITASNDYPSEWEADPIVQPEKQDRGEIVESSDMGTIPIRKIEYPRTSLQTVRLADRPDFHDNPRRWLDLLELLQRRNGDDGVVLFWTEMRQRRIGLITTGDVATKLWATLLDVGFKRRDLLQELCTYANTLYKTTGKRWSKLYVYIMKHLLLNGRSSELVFWHDLLDGQHPPDSKDFVELAREVVNRGELDGLKQIYLRNNVLVAYSNIVPPLVEKEDFATALTWHYLLLRAGDKPTAAKLVEPLVQHYAIYYPWKAKALTKSLVDSGVPFAPSIVSKLKTTEELSGEVMDKIYHKKLGVKPASYNDSLGARWFATKWISLDVAIAAVHALGVEKIGPLSLHSIALRDPSCESVMERISQLRELGISIASSLFSRAVEAFAKDRKQEFLTGLLESDQHPDVLEDRNLQKQLMAEFAQQGDTSSYERTVALLLLDSTAPERDELNIMIRSQAGKGDRTAVLQTLEDMRLKGVPVMVESVSHLVKHTLRRRRKGHNPPTSTAYLQHYSGDIDLTISVLRRIMNHNGFVPIAHWREVVRRLGMDGRLDDLDSLCIWLAEWYNVHTPSRWRSLRMSSPLMSKTRVHLAPAQIPTWHRLHPLRIFFNDPQIQSFLHWGFTHEMLTPNGRKRYAVSATTNPRFTRGFRLLRELEKRGVYINPHWVRRAIFVRLQMVYGPGQSMRKRNRRARIDNPLPLKELLGYFDEAWGKRLFKDVERLEEDILAGKSLYKSGHSAAKGEKAFVRLDSYL